MEVNPCGVNSCVADLRMVKRSFASPSRRRLCSCFVLASMVSGTLWKVQTR